MKPNLIAGLVLSLFAVNAFAGSKKMACLEPVGTETVYDRVITIFHKATITQQKSGQLRGNYTRSGKGQMNYASINVEDDGEGNFVSTKASASLQELQLFVSNEAVELDVVVEKSASTDRASTGKLVGYRSSLRVVTLDADGSLQTQETESLICNPNERRLFVED